MITKIILKEYGIYLLAMLSFQPLMWKIFGLVDWSWVAVSVVPAAFLLIGIGMVVYYTISYWVENYRMGITLGDVLIRLYGEKYYREEKKDE